ncbi:hypothetical protein F383_35229 [Gossypium arboreum]|uniref:Uncharacterized protein n=1 Tax=Gossypium arboreum TaxID=29729 RepID=A0A0B0N656_GOSAR|nr:hypothetical protein F383_35229 [Gossypium arboreum]
MLQIEVFECCKLKCLNFCKLKCLSTAN